MDRNLGDAIRVAETTIRDRDTFNKFIDQLFVAAEIIWPTPVAAPVYERDVKGRFKSKFNEIP
ncbi:MAG: hypothetical protein MN733_01125 [Nitrososphaera sp.]|nr:hypothetical protein [Nitrososphaera sp.]